MAYLKDMNSQCDTCGRPATKELYNHLNALYGWFCTSHAKVELKRLQERELAPLAPEPRAQGRAR